MTALLVVAAVVVAGVVGVLQLRHVRSVRMGRRRLFDAVEPLFDEVRVDQDGLGFPVLTGTFAGHPIRLEPVVDAVAFRKLPVLWLLLTHRRPLEVGAPLDVLLRPVGTEFFSPNAGFDHELAAARGFPSHLRIATPDPVLAPPLSAFEPYLPFLSDRRTKELYVAPGGVRLVRQLAEGGQAHYRTTRRADFGAVVITPGQLLPVLETLTGIGDVLAVEDVRTA